MPQAQCRAAHASKSGVITLQLGHLGYTRFSVMTFIAAAVKKMVV
jgi:hypothetical protein